MRAEPPGRSLDCLLEDRQGGQHQDVQRQRGEPRQREQAQLAR